MAEHRSRSHDAEEATPASAPEDDVSQEAAPAMAVEPRLGFADFLASTTLRPAGQAMLKRWMRQHSHDPDGHYSLAQWQEYEAAMRAATS
jgi:hypothetical protein